MTFDRLPTPRAQRKNHSKQQWSPALDHHGNGSLPEEKQVRSKSWESSDTTRQQTQTSKLVLHVQTVANQTPGHKDNNPSFVNELKLLQGLLPDVHVHRIAINGHNYVLYKYSFGSVNNILCHLYRRANRGKKKSCPAH